MGSELGCTTGVCVCGGGGGSGGGGNEGGVTRGGEREGGVNFSPALYYLNVLNRLAFDGRRAQPKLNPRESQARTI